LPCHHSQVKCILWRYVPENYIFLRELYYVGVNMVHVYCVGCYEVSVLVAWHMYSVCIDIRGVAIKKPDCFYYSFPATSMMKRRVEH